MFPMDKIKKEVCDENSEMDSKEFKIEVKMEDIDPSDVPNIDNNFSNAGCVKTETDFEALFVKDEFEREIVEQQLQNNDETINVPVLLDGSEVKPNLPSKKLVVLPKKVYMDMKSKKKTEEIKKRALSQYMAEREALTREKAVLSTEVGLLKGKVSRGRRAISNFKKQVTLLENRIRYSDEKVKAANMESRRLQDRIDELQTHVCLLSANNSELKQQLENLQVKRGLKRKKSEIITEPNHDRERVENNSKMLTDDGKPSMEVLKQTIISLVKEKNFIEVQLDKKTGELKMTQEKYGKTIMSLSAERRKTEELMKKLDTNEEKKKHSPMVWAFRK